MQSAGRQHRGIWARWRWRLLGVAVALLAAVAILGASGLLPSVGRSDPLIIVEAAIVEAGIPAEVAVEPNQDGHISAHTVTLRWLGDDEVAISEPRFVRYFPAGGHTQMTPAFPDDHWRADPLPAEAGAFYTAGPQCTWSWPDRATSMAACGPPDDPAPLEHGQSTGYRVEWYAAYLDATIEPATYVVEERAYWWHVDPDEDVESIESGRPPDGKFTIRLAYEVQ